MRHVGGQRRNESRWWSEEVGVTVAENRRACGQMLQRRNGDKHKRYQAQRAVVKQAVNVLKIMPYRQ